MCVLGLLCRLSNAFGWFGMSNRAWNGTLCQMSSTIFTKLTGRKEISLHLPQNIFCSIIQYIFPTYILHPGLGSLKNRKLIIITTTIASVFFSVITISELSCRQKMHRVWRYLNSQLFLKLALQTKVHVVMENWINTWHKIEQVSIVVLIYRDICFFSSNMNWSECSRHIFALHTVGILSYVHCRKENKVCILKPSKPSVNVFVCSKRYHN